MLCQGKVSNKDTLLLAGLLVLNLKRRGLSFSVIITSSWVDWQVSDSLYHLTDAITELVCGFRTSIYFSLTPGFSWLLPLVGCLSISSYLGCCLTKRPCIILSGSKTAFPTHCFPLSFSPFLALVRSFNFISL